MISNITLTYNITQYETVNSELVEQRRLLLEERIVQLRFGDEQVRAYAPNFFNVVSCATTTVDGRSLSSAQQQFAVEIARISTQERNRDRFLHDVHRAIVHGLLEKRGYKWILEIITMLANAKCAAVDLARMLAGRKLDILPQSVDVSLMCLSALIMAKCNRAQFYETSLAFGIPRLAWFFPSYSAIVDRKTLLATIAVSDESQ